jgi:GNAT superfamily N-acetyltransferase
MNRISTCLFVDCPELLPTVQRWFETEWPAHYGPGGPGDARADLLAYAQDTLPMGIVAFVDSQPCGFAALKDDAFPSHPQLGPWAGAAFVLPAWRRQGIGAVLIQALETAARQRGFERLHAATATSANLLDRAGWRRIDTVIHDGHSTGIYARDLSTG